MESVKAKTNNLLSIGGLYGVRAFDTTERERQHQEPSRFLCLLTRCVQGHFDKRDVEEFVRDDKSTCVPIHFLANYCRPNNTSFNNILSSHRLATSGLWVLFTCDCLTTAQPWILGTWNFSPKITGRYTLQTKPGVRASLIYFYYLSF